MTPQTDGARILVIDDEPEIRKLLRVALSAHGYVVIEAGTGKQGIERIALDHPDIIILDMGLPDMDGLEVVKAVREWSSVPIIILSVREQDDQKVTALDSGANDYVTKPFSMNELTARIRAALRTLVPGESSPIIRIGELEMDLSRRITTVSGAEVRLTPTEYDLLKYLAINAGKVATHKQLFGQVWGADFIQDVQNLRVYISQLRKKIEPDPSRPIYILTEPGVGYRLAGSISGQPERLFLREYSVLVFEKEPFLAQVLESILEGELRDYSLSINTVSDFAALSTELSLRRYDVLVSDFLDWKKEDYTSFREVTKAIPTLRIVLAGDRSIAPDDIAKGSNMVITPRVSTHISKAVLQALLKSENEHF